jgi:hypothetical protein
VRGLDIRLRRRVAARAICKPTVTGMRTRCDGCGKPTARSQEAVRRRQARVVASSIELMSASLLKGCSRRRRPSWRNSPSGSRASRGTIAVRLRRVRPVSAESQIEKIDLDQRSAARTPQNSLADFWPDMAACRWIDHAKRNASGPAANAASGRIMHLFSEGGRRCYGLAAD